MPDLDQQIEQEKQRYLDFAALNKGKKIYIYGAGKQAAPVADFYREKGVTVAGFCVTDQSARWMRFHMRIKIRRLYAGYGCS